MPSLPAALMRDEPAQRVAGIGEPRREFFEFDVAPARMDDIVVGVDRIDHLPQRIARAVRIDGSTDGKSLKLTRVRRAVTDASQLNHLTSVPV